ncbi:energy transducer TonB [Sphingomonas ginkgonis]|uniref:Energy transducer TonB n=1 Tax=Sphingomonas ginkgonis TaxID=2315330 RepID=A0A429VCR5_9SPHN|nr:energy transducer TonB [Sphingomonas ginkgonis]RST31671.1 energy transducer TonB [Sphingomonas ginkgonis]
MKRQLEKSREEKIGSAAAVIAVHAALGWALIQGLGFRVSNYVENPLKVFDVLPEAPPPPLLVPKPPPPPKVKQSRAERPKDAEGAAAPPAKKNTPTEVVAPKPVLPVPTPIAAAPVAGQGTAAKSGAAPVDGPGTGAGGLGNGTGSGLSGNGPGGGGGGVGEDAEMVSGWINARSDFPVEAVRANAQGTVYFDFTILPTGRVTACQVVRSSGYRILDDQTCRLAQDRFRFRPATDAGGRAISQRVHGRQAWELGRGRDRSDDEEDDR